MSGTISTGFLRSIRMLVASTNRALQFFFFNSRGASTGALAAGREKEGELATTSPNPPPIPLWLPVD